MIHRGRNLKSLVHLYSINQPCSYTFPSWNKMLILLFQRCQASFFLSRKTGQVKTQNKMILIVWITQSLIQTVLHQQLLANHLSNPWPSSSTAEVHLPGWQDQAPHLSSLHHMHIAAAPTDTCHGTSQVPGKQNLPQKNKTMTDTKEFQKDVKIFMVFIQLANSWTKENKAHWWSYELLIQGINIS